MLLLILLGDQTIMTFSVTSGSQKLSIKAEGKYKNAPRIIKVTILGSNAKDEAKVVDVKGDIREGGEVEW